MYEKIKNNNGQTIMEIVVALAIFTIIISAVVSMALGGLSVISGSGSIIRAGFLAQEGIEAVRAIKARAWNELIYNKSAVAISTEKYWVLSGEGTEETIDDFTRTMNYFPVYRSSNGAIVSATTTGAHLDIRSKQISVKVEWTGTNNLKTDLSAATLMTDWSARKFLQNSWIGGSGQEILSDSLKYSSDDGFIDMTAAGAVTLKEIASSTLAASGYLVSSAIKLEKAAGFSSVEWKGDIPAGCASCTVRIQLKTAADFGGNPDGWSSEWSGPDGNNDGDEDDYYSQQSGEIIPRSHNGGQWIKYKLMLAGDGSLSPTVEEIKIFYQ